NDKLTHPKRPLPPQRPIPPRPPSVSPPGASPPSGPAHSSPPPPPLRGPSSRPPPLPPTTMPPSAPRHPAYGAHDAAPASPQPLPRPASFFPPSEPGQPPDGTPTVARRTENSVHTIRQLIESVAIPRITLTIEREGGMMGSRQVVHDGDLCRIGSHPSNDLVLKDPAVSRFHCRLVREDGGWRVRDAGSLNGTRLDTV